ncbi:hypothetical protein JCM5353_003997 [Sporobolomyces roseus]
MGYRSGSDAYASSRQGSSRSTSGAQGYSASSAARGYASSRYAGAGSAGESNSSADEGYGGTSVSTARQGQTGGASDGVDQAAASLATAAESAANSSEKANNLAASHGQSLYEIANAIESGRATEEDAAALKSMAQTLDRFSKTMARTADKAADAQQAHQESLAAAGGTNRHDATVKSYSFGRSGGSRHSGRNRSYSGVFGEGYASTSGGGGQDYSSEIRRSSSRAGGY